MMLRESSIAEIRDTTPDVKTVKTWSAEKETDGIVSSVERRYNVGREEMVCKSFKPF